MPRPLSSANKKYNHTSFTVILIFSDRVAVRLNFWPSGILGRLVGSPKDFFRF